MSLEEKRFKLYSYFYGSSFTLQWYLVYAGVFLIDFSMMGFARGSKFGGWSFIVIGALMAIFGLGWRFYKRHAYNVSGERAVDTEMQLQIEMAKTAGLDKLNIVADQIDSVAPVVLSGVADVGENVGFFSKGSFWKRLLRPLVLCLKFWGFCIVSGLTLLIPALVCANSSVPMFVSFLIYMGFVGAVSYFLYIKVERIAYVNPKLIRNLDKYPPYMIRKYGSDDRIRVTLPAITVYMFSEKQLYVYTRYFDIITGNVFFEGVHEYFYQDVVAVTSKQETITTLKPAGFMNLFSESIDYLQEGISVITSGCRQSETYFVDMGESLLDTEFAGMRNLIRQKKEEK